MKISINKRDKFQRLLTAFATCLLTVFLLAGAGLTGGLPVGIAYADDTLTPITCTNCITVNPANQACNTPGPGVNVTNNGTTQANGSCLIAQCTQYAIKLGSVTSTPQIYNSQCSTAPLVADCIATNGGGGLTQTDGSCLAYPSAILQPNCYTANGSGGLLQVNNQIILPTGPLTTCQAFPLNPSYIVQTGATQTSAIVATALRGYESAAVAAVQQAHNLTTADDAIILDSARNEVRAFLFAQLLAIAQQTTPRSASDQAVMDYYAQKIAAVNQSASQYALNQYNSWNSTICNGNPAGTGWSPPAGFSYDQTTQSIPQCNATIGALFNPGPIPPSYSDFMAYGSAYANQLTPDATTALSATASLMPLGEVAGLGGTAALTSAVMAPLLGATYAYASTEILLAPLITGVGPAVSTVITALNSVSEVAGPFSILITAALIGVEVGVQVSTDKAIPGQLQAQVTASAIPPDMGQLVQTQQGISQFFNVFIASTLPESRPTIVPPAASFSDTLFSVFDQFNSVVGGYTSINLMTRVSQTSSSVRLHGGWFVTTVSDGSGDSVTQYSTWFPYVNWDGVDMIAGIQGNQFILTPAGTNQTGNTIVTNRLDYKDPNGTKYTAYMQATSDLVPVIVPQLQGVTNYSPNNPNLPLWFNTAVQLQWQIEQNGFATAASASGCDPITLSYTGFYSITCNVTSNFGIPTSYTEIIKIDTIPPTVNLGRFINPLPGWWYSYTTMSFTCTDQESGVKDCQGPISLQEGADIPLYGSAHDVAGNQGLLPPNTSINIDRTAPTINGSLSPAANAKGWNNTDVNLSFTCYDYWMGSPGSEQGSGVTGCSSPQATAPLLCLHPNLLSTNSGSLSCGFTQTLSTEGAGQSVTATATDGVGFGVTKTLSQINIDKTPPTITADTSPSPNAYGWNNTNVTVDFHALDNLSGLNTLTPMQTTLSGEGANQYVTSTATDIAGNSDSKTFAVNIDKTPPQITIYSISPRPFYGDWYNTNVTVNWSCSDALSGVQSCPGIFVVKGLGANLNTGIIATDYAGNVTRSLPQTFNIDPFPPVIHASLFPAANAYGWNNSSVAVIFSCADALSGVFACTPAQTLTGQGANQPVTGMAVDLAGNSANASVTVSIDETPPTCSVTAAWPNAVWVTNGKLIPISTQVTVNDALSGPNGFSLVSVTSNGQVSDNIAGWTPGTASTSGQVLATRTSTGAVQTYTLTYQGVDKAGNTTTCSTTVPHS